MKHYKDKEKVYLGMSDIASLTIRSSMKVETLDFGGDGDYSAWIIDGKTPVPNHYSLVFEFKHWVWIFDDNGEGLKLRGDKIKIFRAGEFGCLIQLTGEGATWERIIPKA